MECKGGLTAPQHVSVRLRQKWEDVFNGRPEKGYFHLRLSPICGTRFFSRNVTDRHLRQEPTESSNSLLASPSCIWGYDNNIRLALLQLRL
jgi:hypothetical protein